MIGLKRRTACLVASVVMVGGGVLVAAPGTALAAPTTVHAKGVTTCSNAFLDGDSRLGPEQLPTAGTIYPIVAGYQPLAGLTAAQFIATYWSTTANGGSGGWDYPPDNGFLLNPAGQPDEVVEQLPKGQEIDRFGSVYGAFLAPLDTPYASRALPPMSLDNFNVGITCNYTIYKVVKPFDVEGGPIAPGFGQHGLGRQYQLVASLLPPGASAQVLWLLNNGYLVSVPVSANA